MHKILCKICSTLLNRPFRLRYNVYSICFYHFRYVIPAASTARVYGSLNLTFSPINCCISGINLVGLAIDAPFFYFFLMIYVNLILNIYLVILNMKRDLD